MSKHIFIIFILFLMLSCSFVSLININPTDINTSDSNSAFNNNIGTTRSDNSNHSDWDNDGIADNIDDDDDNDGMPDAWEENWLLYAQKNNLEFRFNTKNASDAGKDWDLDGYSNLNEYRGETNPFNNKDYPQTSHRTSKYDESWGEFLAFLVFAIFCMMVISVIIGIFIIKKRRRDEEFWTSAFGPDYVEGKPVRQYDNLLRDRYLEWQRKIEPSKYGKNMPKHKYKLEIIGGPDSDDEIRHKVTVGSKGKLGRGRRFKHDPNFKGKNCLWCDYAITEKYIKRCPGMLDPKNRCNDGPFCTKRCLNEHLITVPHYQKVEF